MYAIRSYYESRIHPHAHLLIVLHGVNTKKEPPCTQPLSEQQAKRRPVPGVTHRKYPLLIKRIDSYNFVYCMLSEVITCMDQDWRYWCKPG